jgi:hypothetical protein
VNLYLKVRHAVRIEDLSERAAIRCRPRAGRARACASESRPRDRPLLAGALWVMDMVFRDDEFGIRTGHAPANFTAPP